MVAVFDGYFAAKLERQSWIYYSIGVAFILLRLYGRARRLGGVAQHEADDYLQIFAAGLLTILVSLCNIVADNGGSNLCPPKTDPSTFTPAEIDARIQGSKLVLVSEQAMPNLVYVLKACVLILYTRLTLGLSARRFVRWLALYVAVGWAATQIAMFAACRPFSGYWALPPPNPQCATYRNYAVVQGVFNISSNMLMLMVLLPLIVRMSVAWRHKVVLVFVFGLGICVVVASLLNKIYSLSEPFSPRYMLWYIREASVTVYVSNVPLVWPLFREWFPMLRSLKMAGVLPTPHAARSRKENAREEMVLSGAQSQGTNQRAPAPTAVTALMRSNTFREFGRWLRPADVELQKPEGAVDASQSRECILEGQGEGLGRSAVGQLKARRRRSTISGAVIEEVQLDDASP